MKVTDKSVMKVTDKRLHTHILSIEEAVTCVSFFTLYLVPLSLAAYIEIRSWQTWHQVRSSYEQPIEHI